MRHFRLLLSAVLAFILAALSLGYEQRPGEYKERPGVMEFSGEMIVRPLQPDALAKQGKGLLAQVVVRSRAGSRVEPYAVDFVHETDEYVVSIPPGHNENTYSKALMATGDYQYAEPNWICYPAIVPNDPRYSNQWHHAKVKSAEAWNYFTGSPTVVVAVVDTGIDTDHPDLVANRVPGFNSVDRLAEVDGGQVEDINGHGTHVAGCAAAIGNNAVGVAGMGWNFKIMMIRTSNSPGGGASIADITDGARWAADNGAKSVSASYSGVDAAAVGTAGTYIKTKGALFSYAAGNDNRNLTGFVHADTIVVGASDINDNKASFSAYGPGTHVFAPGTNILSTTNGGGYGNSSGTSMACPLVNGAIALIFAANPTLTPNQVQEILESQCDAIGPVSIFNKGRINQLKNMQRVIALNPVDELPDAVVMYEGSVATGTVADIQAPNTGGASFDIESANAPKLGQVAGAEITFATATNPSKMLTMAFTFQARYAGSSSVTGLAFAYNWSTAKWESLGQFPISGNSWTTKSFTQNASLSRFVGPAGVVKVRLRGLGAKSGGRVMPMPFTLRLGHAKLGIAALP